MNLATILFFLVMAWISIILWKRRKQYYLSYQLPGPFAFPIIGNLHNFIGLNSTNLWPEAINIVNRYPERLRLWIGPKLVIVDYAIEDLDIIISKCLEKSFLYRYLKLFFGEGLIPAPGNHWKKHRKIINLSFNIKLIESFFPIMLKQADAFAEEIETWPTGIDVNPKMFELSFKTAIETLFDCKLSHVTNINSYFQNMSNFSRNFVTSYCSFKIVPLLMNLKFLTKYTQHKTLTDSDSFLQKILDTKLSKIADVDETSPKAKIFLNQLLILNKQNMISDKYVFDEFKTFVITAAETTALAVSFVLLVLGIYPEYQNKVLDELNEIFGSTNRKSTLEDLKNMIYLEQVIKETLRLFSIVPIIARETTTYITLADGTVVPPNTTILIPIFKIHTDPRIWNNSFKFDPDRFHPEEFKKLPKNAFLPFSLGSRNCIGLSYAMLSIKVVLAVIIRKYRVYSDQYKSIEDIKFDYIITLRPCNGIPIRLEKRS